MPRIIPEPRYFSMPSTVVGAVALRNEALNWTPCVRSLTQAPFAWTKFAGRDHRCMADESDEIALASRFDPQHAKAVVRIVERDAVDQSRQDLRRARQRRCHPRTQYASVLGRFGSRHGVEHSATCACARQQ